MTGLILAVARAAGEVAPLMLVGVVKLGRRCPGWQLPLFAFGSKFMHLAFIFMMLAFQSPNVEAARLLGLRYRLLLVSPLLPFLNFSAVPSNHLREKYKS